MKPNKLTTLFFFITFTVVMQKISTAQIVYTDVDPDVTSSDTYNLDLNKDGTIDFVIQHVSKSVKGSGKCKGQTGVNQYINITPLNNSQVLDTGNNARMLSANSSIDAFAKSWGGTRSQVMVSFELACAYYCFWGSCYYSFLPDNNYKGEWFPRSEDSFLGLKLTYGGHSYFGWLGMSISEGDVGFIIKDFALNTNPDQAILAGQSSAEYLGMSTVESSLCAGYNVTIPYIITGTFSASNVVTAELSDAAGNFANPVAIGHVTSNVSGNISAVIPVLTPTGYEYHIRVRSSNPARTSYPNGPNLQIVGELPYADIYSTDNITNLCVAGNNVHLQAVTQSCNSYQWKFNGNNIPGATTSSFDAGVVGDYSCEITNGMGTAISNTITVNSEPPSITIYEDHANCNGTVVVYAIDDNSDNTLSNFQWKLNGVDIPGATFSGYNATATGDYSCVKSNNCGSITSNTITVTNDLLLMADATITPAGPTAICSGPVVLTANTGAGLNYQWYTGYDPIPGATSSSYSASVSGDYSVREINSSGCLRDKSISIIIGAPTVNIVYSSPLSICHNHPVDLYTSYQYVYEESNATNFSLQWIKDGVDISRATGSLYDARDPGSYSVRVTIAPGGCSSTSASVVITKGCTEAATTNSSTINMPESLVLNGPGLKISPNPVTNTAIVSFALQVADKVSLDLFDVTGRLVRKFTDKEYNEGIHYETLDTKDMGSGVYVLRMKSQGILQTQKFTVIK